MKNLGSSKWHVLSLATLSLAGVAAADPQPVPAPVLPRPAASPTPTAITHPEWKNDILGRVFFDQRRDQRRGEDRWNYRLNEDGVIKGEDLLNLAHPAEQALFEQVMRSRPRQPDANANSCGGRASVPADRAMSDLYQEYLKQLTDQALSVLVMNRIVDHEAMKRKISPEVTDERVRYVMRAIMHQNALAKKKVRTVEQDVRDWRTGAVELDDDCKPRKEIVPDQDIGMISNQQMYVWIKETVGENPVRFNMDWKFSVGMGYMKDDLHRRGELDWPPITLSFSKMPATWQEFETELKKKMQPSYKTLLRHTIWRVLIQERNPNLMWESLFAVTTTELAKMYDAMKASAFKVQEQDAHVSGISISGAKAAEFKGRFFALMSEKQQSLLTEIFGRNPNGAENADDQARLKAKITELRNSVPKQAYDQVATEFAADIVAGRVKASFENSSIHWNGLDELTPAARPVAPVCRNGRRTNPVANADSIENQQKRMAFNPMFGSMALFPKHDAIDSSGVIKVMFLRELAQGAASFLPADDARVEKVLRGKILSKQQGKVFRDVAFNLFRENKLEWVNQTCSESVWPCGTDEARRFAELLFPETLHANATLGCDGPGRPVRNTLGRPELHDRVLDISSDLFNRVFEVPNDYQDPNYRLHRR